MQQISQSLDDKEEHKYDQLQGSSLCSFSESLNVEEHENGKQKGKAYVKHVSFHYEEEVDSLSMLEVCHEEALIDTNQQIFDLQSIVP